MPIYFHFPFLPPRLQDGRGLHVGRAAAYQFGKRSRQVEAPAPVGIGIELGTDDTVAVAVAAVEVVVVVHLRQDDEEGGEGDGQPYDVEHAGGEEPPEGMGKVAVECFHDGMRLVIMILP